jgi:hypothetical protein
MAERHEQWVKRVLGVEANAASRPCLPIWIAARDEAGRQLASVQSALRGLDLPLASQIADKGLAGLTRRLQVGLHVALQEFDTAEADRRRAAAQQATAHIARLRKFLATHPALPRLEENPLNLKVTLRKTLGDALTLIQQRIEA